MNKEEIKDIEPNESLENHDVSEKRNFIERNRFFQISEVIVSNGKLFQFVLLIGALFEVYKIIFKYRLEKDWLNIGYSVFFIGIYVYFINHLKNKNSENGGVEK